MTRFMMTLDDAVDLVIYAFLHGKNGDLFVQKAPAATLNVLANALKKIYSSNAEIRVIGTRHGESYMRHWLLVKKCQKQKIWVIIIVFLVIRVI